MGLTIHYSLVRERSPEELLKKAEALAKKLGFKIEERSWNKLIINPHKESEWIELHFHKKKTIVKREGWDLEKKHIEENRAGETYDDDWFCGGFVKTHYAGWEAHIQVAEFMRFIASYCEKSNIHDESDYYEKGYSEESAKELKEFLNDYNKSLGNITSKLKEAFGKGNVILGADL